VRPFIHDLSWYALLAAQSLALWRLCSLGRRYLWIAVYIAFDLARWIAVFGMRASWTQSSGWRAYALVWIVTEPVGLGLMIAATFEIIGRVPDHYFGFGAFGRRHLRRLLQAAIAIALVTSVIEAGAHDWPHSLATLLPAMTGLKRITASTISLFLLFLIGFVVRNPVPVARNLRAHVSLFGTYVLLIAGTMLWINTQHGGRGTAASDLILTLGSAALFAGWFVLLDKNHERMPERRVMSDEEAEALELRQRELLAIARRACGETEPD
jgi:hypothetical protein